MPDQPISPLRQRMIEDMMARRFGEHTQRDYVRAVKRFAAYLGCSPDKASAEDLRRYQLHLSKQHISPTTINQACSALRFFFKITLERPNLVRHLAPVQRPRKMPAVLSQDEVARLIEAAPSLKYRAALSVAFRSGSNAAKGSASGTLCSRRSCSHSCANGGARRTAVRYRKCLLERTALILLGF
jgi:site-specific recombinase XerC